MENKEEIFNEVINEVYSHYSANYSLRRIMSIHPMNYNGQLCDKPNHIQEEIEPFLTKDEFLEKLNDDDFKYSTAVTSLFNYISKIKREN